MSERTAACESTVRSQRESVEENIHPPTRWQVFSPPWLAVHQSRLCRRSRSVSRPDGQQGGRGWVAGVGAFRETPVTDERPYAVRLVAETKGLTAIVLRRSVTMARPPDELPETCCHDRSQSTRVLRSVFTPLPPRLGGITSRSAIHARSHSLPSSASCAILCQNFRAALSRVVCCWQRLSQCGQAAAPRGFVDCLKQSHPASLLQIAQATS